MKTKTKLKLKNKSKRKSHCSMVLHSPAYCCMCSTVYNNA